MNLRILVLSLLLILPLFLHVPKALAHPIGNTDSYFYFEKEVDDSVLDEKDIKVYSYINFFQSALIVKKAKGFEITDIYELPNYQSLYDDYVKSHVKIFNNNNECNPNIQSVATTSDQMSMTLGMLVIADFQCDQKIENVKIMNDMFVADFPLQSNFTNVYTGDTLLHAVTIDKEDPTYEFNKENLKANPKGDETVDNSANMSAEQVMQSFGENSGTVGSDIQVVAGSSMAETEQNSTEESTQNNSASENLGDTTPKIPVKGPKTVSFISGLTDALFLKTNVAKDQSIFLLLALVFALGFLHTVEAGHSKAILASSMLHHKMDIKKGLAYAAIFTLTHLGDIIIVGLILLAADNYFNILSNFTMVEKYAGIALFFLALYLFMKNLESYVRNLVAKRKHLEAEVHTHSHINPELSFRDQLLLGFLAGLAPCVFGWSIFMLILSTNKIWVLVPAILFFGLGIFVALAFVVFIMSHLKKGAYNRFEKIAEISPMISALFLLVYAIFLIF